MINIKKILMVGIAILILGLSFGAVEASADYTFTANKASYYSTNPNDTSQKRMRFYDSGNALGWNATEWISFDGLNPDAGRYSVSVKGYGDSTATLKFSAGDMVLLNNAEVKSTGSWGKDSTMVIYLGEIQLLDNITSLRIDMLDGGWTFYEFYLTKVGEYGSESINCDDYSSFKTNDGIAPTVNGDNEEKRLELLSGEEVSYTMAGGKSGLYFARFNSTAVNNGLAQINGMNLVPTGGGENASLINLSTENVSLNIKCVEGSFDFGNVTLSPCELTAEEEKLYLNEFNKAANETKIQELFFRLPKLINSAAMDKLFYKKAPYTNVNKDNYTSLAQVKSDYEKGIYMEFTNPKVYSSRIGQYVEITVDESLIPSDSIVIGAVYDNNMLLSVDVLNTGTLKLSSDCNLDNFKLFIWNRNYQPVSNYSKINNLYVAVDGLDENVGNTDFPLKTIDKAKTIAVSRAKEYDTDVTVHISSGEYNICEPIQFGAEDSSEHIIKFLGNNSVISGGQKVNGWEKYDDKIWVANVDCSDLRHLYINDKRAVRAKSQLISMYFGSGVYNDESTSYENDGIKTWAVLMPKGLEGENNLELVWDLKWTRQRVSVDRCFKSGSELVFDLQKQDAPYYQYAITNSYSGTRPVYNKAFTIENAFSLLDEEGEFYYNNAEKKLYYYPRTGENLNNADCRIGVSEGLIKINNGKNLSFSGIEFKHGDWLEPNENGAAFTQGDKMLNSCNESASGGGKRIFSQIDVSNSENIKITNCSFENLGSSAISMSEGNHNCNIENNTFSGLSGGAITIGSWKHLFYEENPLMCQNIKVYNNKINDVSYEYSSVAAVSVYYAKNINISHNEIDFSRWSGISIGWGWNNLPLNNGNNTIAFNRITNTMTELSDGSAIYTLGNQGGLTIENNYIADCMDSDGTNYGIRGGIYTDQGSAKINIEGNVVENCYNWLFARAMEGNSQLSDVLVNNNFANSREIVNDPDTIDTASVNLGETTYYNNPSDIVQNIIDSAGLE